VLDAKWKDQLFTMDALKSGIGLRSYAQIDPKNEYKKEGLAAFEHLLSSISDDVTNIIFKLRVEVQPQPEDGRGAASAPQAREAPASSKASGLRASQGAFAGFEAQRKGREQAMQAAGRSTQTKTIKREQAKVGRNDPCPCGSGKKYKKCCGQTGGSSA
jgi:preprotein translocase subunit SecA